MIPNIENYNEKKTKGLISVQKINDSNYAICIRQFSVEDGSEQSAQVQGITIAEIDEKIADYQTKINELTALKTDIMS